MSSPPRYATRRRPDRPTIGPAVEVMARTFGTALMPWQRHAVDVAGEHVDGRPAYRYVIISAPRRAGKSLLTLAVLFMCALSAPARRAWYTAQSRADAALTFRDEWIPAVTRSPLAPFIRPRQSNGSESFIVPRLASTIRVFAPTGTALHGQAGDLIMFDEAWSHTAERGQELEVAARPLMATRPGAQMWILSAAGDIDSTWWANWLDAGRTAVDADAGAGICHLEWSADAPGVDLDDPAVWVATHPAVRGPDNPTGTIDLDWLTAEHALDPDTFYRAYLNVTDRAGITTSPIDAGRWQAAAVDQWHRAGIMVAGVDAAPNQTHTSIVVAGEHAGRPVVELVDYRPGIGWVIDRVVELVDRWGLETVAVDRNGPAGALWAGLEQAAVPLTDMTLRDTAAAAAQLVEAVRTGELVNVPSSELDAAVTGARRRPHGDGSWTFSRNTSTVDVSPLIAASLARAVHPALDAAPAGIH
jgi:phage terminase large subunit-like protein